MVNTIEHTVDFCVIGGGLSGMCAALAAARHGVKTLIMQERPMFGGNASSEIRMWVCGSHSDMETGLIEEIRLENMHRNTYSAPTIWDGVLFEKMKFQPNLTCLLNCTCMEADSHDGKIESVKGWQMTTQTFHIVKADYFADCSGDSILALLVGAEYKWGREARAEFGESLAPETADSKTMGLSCIMQARETDSPKKFIPPAWASKFPTDDSFPKRPHTMDYYQNFWWLELGGNGNSIADTEEVRDALLKDAYGLWDHIKNQGDHGADNWLLDWIGILPGKRESRRCLGDYLLKQKDVLENTPFEDIVAYGGWPVDDHHPDGFRHFGEPNTNIVPKQSYGIPLRCLYSRNISNLLFAGRNISTTHTGLSSTRVMATCATLGQAIGTAVFHAIAAGRITPRQVAQQCIADIQQTLLNDDCWLLGKKREIAREVMSAKLTASQGNPESLRNGLDRPWKGEENAWNCTQGDTVSYEFDAPRKIAAVRLVFDSDLKRMPHNIAANYWLRPTPFEPPKTLVKAFHILADGKEVFRTTDNYQRFVRIPLDTTAQNITLVIDETRQDSARLFDFEPVMG